MSRRRVDAQLNLLENQDEAEVKHLTHLLKHPPSWAGKELRVVTWSGGWLCICGRVCWAKQHCKQCGQLSPCRDWCFANGCHKPFCKFEHPPFFLPKEVPQARPGGKLAVDGRELLQLPPPGSVPAAWGPQRQQAAAAAVAANRQPEAVPAPLEPQTNYGWIESAPEATAHNAAASAMASGGGAGSLWADLEERARAAMPNSASGASINKTGSVAAGGSDGFPGSENLPPMPGPSASATGAAAYAAPTQSLPFSQVCAAMLPAQPFPGMSVQPAAQVAAQPAVPPAGDEAELDQYLAMLGIN